MSAKELEVRPIRAHVANDLVRRVHYSGKVVRNSQVHLGVFYRGKLEGAMQFGPSMDKRRMRGLVTGTRWNGFLELNRMAFSDALPRNAESRALGVAFRILRKAYPHIEWVISFADATECGDGTIYRASGFLLLQVKRNSTILVFPSGERISDLGLKTGTEAQLRIFGKVVKGTEALREAKRMGAVPAEGFQIKYIRFLNPEARKRLTVPVLPFSALDEAGARMYRGEAREG